MQEIYTYLLYIHIIRKLQPFSSQRTTFDSSFSLLTRVLTCQWEKILSQWWGGIFLKGERSIKNKSVLRSEVDLRDFFSVTASSSCISLLYVLSLVFLFSLISSGLLCVCDRNIWKYQRASVTGLYAEVVCSSGWKASTQFICSSFTPSFIITCFFFSTPPLTHSTSFSCTPYLPPSINRVHQLLQAPPKQLFSHLDFFCRTKICVVYLKSVF